MSTQEAVMQSLPEVMQGIEMTQVPVIDIDPDPEQPRKVFDETGLNELAESLASEGLLQPITIRQNPRKRKKDRPYLLIAGERRWRAANILGWEQIPVIIRNDVTEAEAAKLQLLENIVRRDLNPVEEARAFSKMLNEGYTKQELSKATGIATAIISQRIEMLTVRPDVLDLVAAGHMKPNVAFRLSKLSLEGQNRVLKTIGEKKMHWGEVTRLIKSVFQEEQQIEMFPELPKLTVEQKRVAKTFGTAFGKIVETLDKLHRMEDKNPGQLAEALAAEAEVIEKKITYAIKGLNRVQTVLEASRMRRLALTISSPQTDD